MLAALRHGVLEHEGKYIQCKRAYFYPRVRVPPVLIGGGVVPGMHAADDRLVEPVLLRVARYGHGWLLDWGDPPLIKTGIERIRNLARGHGRDGMDFDIGVSTQMFLDDTDEQARKWTERSVEGTATAPTGDEKLGRRSPKRFLQRSLIGSPATVREKIHAYAACGVNRFVMTSLAPDLQSFLSMMARFSDEVRRAFR